MNAHRPDCPCRNLQRKYSLITAAEFGVVSNEHLSSNAHSKLSSGYSPLHLAAQHNNVESTKLLLTQNDICVDGVPKFRGGCGATPLHRASFSGACSCMKLLIEEGANLFAKDESFGDLMSPLHKAVAAGRYDAVKLILNSITNDSDLKKMLELIDVKGRNALNLIQEILSNSESFEERRRSVARWNQTAGGEPDWNLCLIILKNAYKKLDVSGSIHKFDGSHQKSRKTNTESVIESVIESDLSELSTTFGIKLRDSLCIVCDDEKSIKSFLFYGSLPKQSFESIRNTESGLINAVNKVVPKRSNKKADQFDDNNNNLMLNPKHTSLDENHKEKPRTISSTGQKCGICAKQCLVLCRSKDKKLLVCRSCRRLNKRSKDIAVTMGTME